MACVITNLVF